jgi:hypothetical protein
MQMPNHKEREHSKFSASGSERWLNCAASVALEEISPPSEDSPWSREGTLAHEVLECLLLKKPLPKDSKITNIMIGHCKRAADKIREIKGIDGGRLWVEKKWYALYIHDEMFGTCDAVIASPGGTLHIIDFKYGQGHIVDVNENTQLIQYALSVAEDYAWNFDSVKMWILQPRAGENWSPSWEITIKELKEKWLPLWEKGVARVEADNNKPFPGSWCHWCRAAKAHCPAKAAKRVDKVVDAFKEADGISVERKTNGKEKSKKEKVRFQGEAEATGFEAFDEDWI